MTEYNLPVMALHPFSMFAHTGFIGRIAAALKLAKWKNG